MSRRSLGQAEDLAMNSPALPVEEEVLKNSGYVPSKLNGAHAKVGNKPFTDLNGKDHRPERVPSPFSRAYPPKAEKLPEELKDAVSTWRPTRRLVAPHKGGQGKDVRAPIKHKPK
jgi:hypothetical protein